MLDDITEDNDSISYSGFHAIVVQKRRCPQNLSRVLLEQEIIIERVFEAIFECMNATIVKFERCRQRNMQLCNMELFKGAKQKEQNQCCFLFFSHASSITMQLSGNKEPSLCITLQTLCHTMSILYNAPPLLKRLYVFSHSSSPAIHRQ